MGGLQSPEGEDPLRQGPVSCTEGVSQALKWDGAGHGGSGGHSVLRRGSLEPRQRENISGLFYERGAEFAKIISKGNLKLERSVEAGLVRPRIVS